MTEQSAPPAPIPSGANTPDTPASPEAEKPKFTPTSFSPVDGAPEAFGIAWTELHGWKHDNVTGQDMVFKINVTGRGRTAREALENLVDVITDGKMNLAEFRREAHLGLYPHVPEGKKPPAVNTPAENKKAPANQAPAPAAPAAQSPAAPPAPASNSPVNQAQNLGGQITGGVFRIVAMDVLPRADGRVDLKFFGNDKKQPRNQYPDITWTIAPETACEKLATVGGFMPEHLAKAQTYNLPCKLHWVNSDKLNRNQVPYKNVVSFEPAG